MKKKYTINGLPNFDNQCAELVMHYELNCQHDLNVNLNLEKPKYCQILHFLEAVSLVLITSQFLMQNMHLSTCLIGSWQI